MDEIKIRLTGPIPSKKNSRTTQRSTGRTFPSKRYKEWWRDAGIQLLEQRVTNIAIEQAEVIWLAFIFPDRRRRDLTNAAESVMDLLVDHKILIDDCWTVTGEVHLIPHYEKGVAGCDIRIFPLRAVPTSGRTQLETQRQPVSRAGKLS